MPVYNEASSVREVIRLLTKKKINGIELEIIIVESNSNDGSREIVQEFADEPSVRIILEELPKGKGHAVRAGIAAATGDIILIQDADLEYSLDDYEKLLDPIISGKADFVLGTRHTEGNWHMRRFSVGNHYAVLFNLAHWGFTAMLNYSLGTRMTDPFTMFKVFRKSCLDGIKLECNGFDLDWELVIKLIRAEFRPLEIPVSYHSRDYSEGKKVSILNDPPMWIAAWWKYAVLRVDSNRFL